MRRLLLIAAAGAVLVYVSAPPPARPLPTAPSSIAEPVRGVVHIHTRRSDGSGTIERVARAAAGAGLQFIVVTDHGDGTRTPYPPAYEEGVLVIDAVEISTEHGHVLALGLGQTPYPLAGEARDVVEDVHRLGGFAVAAHPGSRKADLRWTDWGVPIDGLEHLNGDSEWRDEAAWDLARGLLAYPVRSSETLALLFDRDVDVGRRWDELTRSRRVVALAGADAHGRIALRAEEPYRGRIALPVPAYEAVFRSMSISLPAARLLSGAAADGRTVLEEIRAGHVFSSVDALAARPRFSFSASSGRHRAFAGDRLSLDGAVRVEVAVQAPADAEIRLLRDGAPVATAAGAALQYDAADADAVYRVEVMLPGAPGEPPVPWIVSNPIYVGGSDDRAVPAPRAGTVRTDLYTDGPAPEVNVEHSSPSSGAVDVVKAVSGTQLLLRYALSGEPSSHPFAALVIPAGAAIAEHDRIVFTARADKPLRLSVQLRAPGGDPAGERWHRSVFVDTTPREISVRFDDMRPRGITSAPRPPLDTIRSVLFVVDTVNTSVGTAGQVFLDDLRYVR